MNFQTLQLNTVQNELERLFESYAEMCKYNKRLSIETIKSYTHVFKTFLKIMPEITTLKDLHPQMMPEFFKRISTRKRVVGRDTIVSGIKPSTIKTYHNKLIAFFRWLEFNNHIETSYLTSRMIRPPQPVYDDERALDDKDISKIIASITLYGMHDDFAYKRDLLIVSLLLYTGIRKGELLGLRISDIDFNAQTLFINGVTSKSKTSRNIPLHFSLITHLKSYLKAREQRHSKCEALIISCKNDTPLSEHGIKHWVKKYKMLSGVNFHIHRFRHTFACKLAKENADIISIMNVMGHSTTRTTERYLRSIKAEHSRSFIDKMTF